MIRQFIRDFSKFGNWGILGESENFQNYDFTENAILGISQKRACQMWDSKMCINIFRMQPKILKANVTFSEFFLDEDLKYEVRNHTFFEGWKAGLL